MARAVLEAVRIVGLSVCVPKRAVDNLDVSEQERPARERLVRNIGIRFRRVCDGGMIFSDLAERATQDLLQGVGWDKSTVDAYIFVHQSPEYVIPSTSIICQHRVGFPHTTLAFDINLGCSGYPYGLYTVGSMLKANGLKRAIVVIGDQAGSIGSEDGGREILFGDGASATALEFDASAPPMYFEGFSDGAGFKAIYIPDGGRRNPLTPMSIVPRMAPDGVVRTGTDVALDGPAIMNFSTKVAPESVRSICEFAGLSLDQVDYFVFHQANMMINKLIRSKLKLEEARVPTSLHDYGNTSSASIPVSLVHQARDAFTKPGTRFIFCGFGIGLSWASLLIETSPDTYCSEIIEA